MLGLGKAVAHAAGTDTDEHFHEIGTRHREERYAGLSGHSLGKQSLTCSRRSDEQGSLRNLSTQVGIFLRVLEKLHDLLHFLLGTFLSGNVLEGDAELAGFLVELGFALAYAEHATGTACAATHASADEPHQHEEDDQRGEVDDQRHDVAGLGVVVAVAGKLAFGLLGS